MERKNRYYRELIAHLKPSDVLPGALQLINEARGRDLKVGLASASKNARDVLTRLEITDHFDSIVDGYTPGAPKPAPDLFLASAASLGAAPDSWLARRRRRRRGGRESAGMMTVGIGPAERVERRTLC